MGLGRWLPVVLAASMFIIRTHAQLTDNEGRRRW